jgi:exonuclease III
MNLRSRALPAPFKCLTWNADHLYTAAEDRRTDKLSLLLEYLKSQNPHTVFLQECGHLRQGFSEILRRAGYHAFISHSEERQDLCILVTLSWVKNTPSLWTKLPMDV